MPDGFWVRVSQLLGAAWLLTLFAWWWSARNGKREPRAPEPPPVYRQQAKLVKAARKAALAGDGAALRSALLDWGRLDLPAAQRWLMTEYPELPLYLVILMGVALGLLIGFVWEWLREYKHRAAARAKAREVRRLEGEIGRMQAEKHEGKDEVLALLEGAEGSR